MPRADGIYYETAGEGEIDGVDTVTFVGDVGFGPWQWGWQAPTLAGPYRTVVPTSRDCGRSATPPTPWTPEDLLGDVRAVWRDAGVRRTHLVGAGLGGRLALAAAARFDRVGRVALLGTPHRADDFDAAAMAADPDDRDACRASIPVTDAFRTDHPDALDRIAEWRIAEDAPREAWTAARDALRAVDPEPYYEVTAETLVVHGDADRVCPPESGRALADDLPRAEFHAIPEAGHLVGCEAARPVNDRLLAFFGELD